MVLNTKKLIVLICIIQLIVEELLKNECYDMHITISVEKILTT